MASNMAARRFKKAVRRKAIVAEKQKAEKAEAALPAQVRRTLVSPIRHCLLQESLSEGGLGTLVVARGITTGDFMMGTFLLDTYCLGIKDVFFRPIDADELDYIVETMERTAPVRSVDPAYARKLLRDLAAWAASLGFQPHPDFAAVEQILGDADADSCDAVFQFGRDGKPLYVPGPHESSSLVRARVEQLRKRLGDEGFDVMHAA